MAGQFAVVDAATAKPGQALGRVSLFNEDGTPWEPGGSGPASVAWGDVTGKPSTFPPATHTHAVGEVTGLQAVLDDLETRLAALESA